MKLDPSLAKNTTKFATSFGSIPPSPPEVREFKVEKVPTIVVFDTSSRELGKIIENPAPGKTLEEEILQLAKI